MKDHSILFIINEAIRDMRFTVNCDLIALKKIYSLEQLDVSPEKRVAMGLAGPKYSKKLKMSNQGEWHD